MKPFLAEDSAQTRILSEQTGVLMGSTVLTLDGALPVEFLTAGDRIITRDCGVAELCQLEVVDLDIPMVRINRGALAPSLPARPVLLPAAQKLLLRETHQHISHLEKPALIAAKHLIDGQSVHAIGRQAARLFQLVFRAPHIIYVDGLELACERPLAHQDLAA